jgi:hypothetical protein
MMSNTEMTGMTTGLMSGTSMMTNQSGFSSGTTMMPNQSGIGLNSNLMPGTTIVTEVPMTTTTGMMTEMPMTGLSGMTTGFTTGTMTTEGQTIPMSTMMNQGLVGQNLNQQTTLERMEGKVERGVDKLLGHQQGYGNQTSFSNQSGYGN